MKFINRYFLDFIAWISLGVIVGLYVDNWIKGLYVFGMVTFGYFLIIWFGHLIPGIDYILEKWRPKQ